MATTGNFGRPLGFCVPSAQGMHPIRVTWAKPRDSARNRSEPAGAPEERDRAKPADSVMLRMCEAPAKAMLPCTSLVYPLYIPCTSLVHPLYIPCTSLVHPLYTRCAPFGTAVVLRCLRLKRKPRVLIRRYSRRVGFRRGAVETELALRRVGIDEIQRAAEDLVGANGGPVTQVGGVFDPEPGAIRTS